MPSYPAPSNYAVISNPDGSPRASDMPGPGRLFIVTPCFNEAQALPHFLQNLCQTLDAVRERGLATQVRILCVDDGSTDSTWQVLEHISQTSAVPIDAVRFSRNFGHQSAICAGLEELWQSDSCSQEDTVIIMDSDGQHPPELIFELIAARSQGYHHVQMTRTNSGAGWFKGLTSRLYYSLFRLCSGLRLEAGSSDFRAFSGLFLSEYLRCAESTKFNRGLFQWLGFKTRAIPYRANFRKHGSSKYSLRRMLSFGATGITYFSSRPLVLTLTLTTLLGFVICGAYILFELYRIWNGAVYVPGWPTVLFVVTLWGSLLSLGQLLTAIYVARIFDEVKGRPAYIIERRLKASAQGAISPLQHYQRTGQAG